MERFREFPLDVWREACRHIRIEESATTIAHLLMRHMPLDRLVVFELDPGRGMLTTRVAALGAGADEFGHLQHLEAGEVRLFKRWAKRKAISRVSGHANQDDIARLLLRDQGGHWLLGPLCANDEPTGAIALRAESPRKFGSIHEKLCKALLDPFAAALENDRRLHEVNALREAAEADKRSALTRLGRVGLTDTIIGAEVGLRPVMERIALVVRTDVPVLLLGETGSGKEVIARAIHDRSPRAKGPFIRINCGAIPPELIDSELFGHEKGAFTGATSRRLGWFERADQGTLLLDEVGDLPLPAQVRLLRVLQEGTFDRVGGEQSMQVDVRIIAATHRDLAAMVQNARFREDLWYRIAGFPIVIPPLRERKQDIAALAEHFAQRAARRFGLKPQRPTPADLALLASYDWPGNIRELISVIDRAAILGEGHTLEIAKSLGTAQSRPARPAPAVASTGDPSAGSIASLNEAMRWHIEAALATTRGRIEGPRGAAVLLNINPHTLRARMRKLGIEWRTFRRGETS